MLSAVNAELWTVNDTVRAGRGQELAPLILRLNDKRMSLVRELNLSLGDDHREKMEE